jgi:hypothetical protein
MSFCGMMTNRSRTVETIQSSVALSILDRLLSCSVVQDLCFSIAFGEVAVALDSWVAQRFKCVRENSFFGQPGDKTPAEPCPGGASQLSPSASESVTKLTLWLDGWENNHRNPAPEGDQTQPSASALGKVERASQVPEGRQFSRTLFRRCDRPLIFNGA